MLEIDHLHADFRFVFAEHRLRLIGPVEILARRVFPRPGMVATDDEVGDPVVGADQSVPHRFTRPRHPHRQVQQAHRRGRGRVFVDHRLIAAHPGKVVDVARFGHANHRMDQQVRLRLARRAERQFLMGAVQRVAGLECHDLVPAHLAEIGAQFVRRVAPRFEIIMHRGLQAFDLATQIDRPRDVVQVVHRRMRQIIRAKDLDRLIRLVRHIFVGNRHHCQNHAFRIAQRNPRPRCHAIRKLFADIQRDRYRPQRALGQVQCFHDRGIISLSQKPCQRVEPAIHQQFQIADLTQRQIPRRHRPRCNLQLGGGIGRNVKFRNGRVV